MGNQTHVLVELTLDVAAPVGKVSLNFVADDLVFDFAAQAKLSRLGSKKTLQFWLDTVRREQGEHLPRLAYKPSCKCCWLGSCSGQGGGEGSSGCTINPQSASLLSQNLNLLQGRWMASKSFL